MSKSVSDYNPSDVGVNNGNFFGMPFEANDSRLVLISVPWDVTSSYGSGASSAPDAIIEASTQLDFYDPFATDEWRKGIGTVPIDYSIQDESNILREDSERIIEVLESDGDVNDNFILKHKLDRINQSSEETNEKVYTETSDWLSRGKLVGVVGGDHSTPYGYIKALAERETSFGILQFDAHCDLRVAYEGFKYSHASIMYNVMSSFKNITRLVQVGVRDYCDDEVAYATELNRVVMFDDLQMHAEMYGGATWASLCDRIVKELPERVYVSFDIDGLSPENCPHTGTPVAGGLSYNEAIYLLHAVTASGRTIIGFDLCEVVPEHAKQWDANVGARVLYKLCGQTLKSNK